MIKEKEKIRTQVLKTLTFYRRDRGFQFFDDRNGITIPDAITLEENEAEIFLMRINRSVKILVTTKHIHILRNKEYLKIHGTEIEDYDLLPRINYEPKDQESRLRMWYVQYQLRRHTGYFRITRKDKTTVKIYLPKKRFTYAISDSLKKLKFVANKYEAV